MLQHYVSSFSTIFTRKKAPAAAVKMNEDINNIMFHYFRQYSVGKKAPAVAIKTQTKR